MENFFQWLTVSSADPNKVATTVKGVLIGIIPMALYFGGLFHLSLGSDQLNNAVGLITQIIQVGLGAVAGLMTAYGLIRKLFLTFTGK